MTLFHIVVFPKAINTSTLLLMLSDPTKAHIVTIDVPWFLGDDVRTSPAKSFGEINTAADLCDPAVCCRRIFESFQVLN